MGELGGPRPPGKRPTLSQPPLGENKLCKLCQTLRNLAVQTAKSCKYLKIFATFVKPATAGDISPDGPPGASPQGKDAGDYHYVDVHGAGAQRSDPKAGDPAMFPHGRGPQGDVIRINNFVRVVRDGPG